MNNNTRKQINNKVFQFSLEQMGNFKIHVTYQDRTMKKSEQKIISVILTSLR
jgi:hypothetical protein